MAQGWPRRLCDADPDEIMKNPGFIIVGVVLAVAPLMRGSVHPWGSGPR